MTAGQPANKGLGTVWKVLIGCGVLIGGVFMIGIGACVGFTVWVNQPGQLIEPSRLYGPETVGAVEWTLRMDDPGTEAFVDGALNRVRETEERAGANALPGLLKSFKEFNDSRNAAELKRLFPAVLAATVDESGPEPADRRVTFCFSIRGAGNKIRMVDWMLGWIWSADEKQRSESHGGEKIFLVGGSKDQSEPPAFFIRGGDVFISSDVFAARAMIDRLTAPQGSVARPRTDDLLAQVPETAALRGAFLNEHGELGRLLEVFDLAEAPGLADGVGKLARNATLTGGFEGSDLFSLTVRFVCRDRECAETVRALEGAAGSGPGAVEAAPAAVSLENDGRATVVLKMKDPVSRLVGALVSLDKHDGGNDSGQED